MRPHPPVLAAAAALVQRRLARGDEPRGSVTRRLLAAGISAGSGLLPVLAIREFRRQGTTVDPHAVTRSTALVTTGPNGITRNPMYVGLAGQLVANAVRTGSVRALLPAAAFVVVIDRWQIAVEEAALRERYGAEYAAYCSAVPRWLDRRSWASLAGVSRT